MKTTIQALLIAALVALIFAVSSADYEDAKREQQVYCDNVQAGYWPDYNHNAAEVCK